MINSPDRLDDRDILYDCLEGSRWGATVYNRAILEAANEPVRSAFIQLHHDEIMLHRNIFETINQRGYDPVRPETTWSVAQTQTAFYPQQG